MIYQDYFRNSDFEDIWVILSGFYLEHEGMKPLYSSLVETIKSLPIKPEYSTPAIQMRLDSDNEIMVIGAPKVMMSRTIIKVQLFDIRLITLSR